MLVQAPDVTSPRVLRWMADYQARVARRHGWRPGRPAPAELCPALSLTGLFNDAGRARPAGGRSCGRCRRASPATCSRRTAAPPTWRSRAPGRPLDDQQKLFEDMRAQLDPPPAVKARSPASPCSRPRPRRASRRAGGCWPCWPWSRCRWWWWPRAAPGRSRSWSRRRSPCDGMGLARGVAGRSRLDPLTAVLGAWSWPSRGSGRSRWRAWTGRGGPRRTGGQALERMDVGRAERLAALAALIGLAAPDLSGVADAARLRPGSGNRRGGCAGGDGAAGAGGDRAERAAPAGAPAPQPEGRRGARSPVRRARA